MNKTLELAKQILDVLILNYGSGGTLLIAGAILLLVIAWFWWQDRKARKAVATLRELLREKDIRIAEKDSRLEELRVTLDRVEADLSVYQRGLTASGGKLLPKDTDRLIAIEEEFRAARTSLPKQLPRSNRSRSSE